MNIEGLCELLSDFLGTEVVHGLRRGAQNAKDHPPRPNDTHYKATITFEDVDSPGRPHRRQVFNATANAFEEVVTTEQVARAGLRLESFKGAERYSYDELAQLRGKMFTDDFLLKLRQKGFALADSGKVVRLASQAADVAILEFTLVFAEVVPGNPAVSWIETVHGTGTAQGTTDVSGEKDFPVSYPE